MVPLPTLSAVRASLVSCKILCITAGLLFQPNVIRQPIHVKRKTCYGNLCSSVRVDQQVMGTIE